MALTKSEIEFIKTHICHGYTDGGVPYVAVPNMPGQPKFDFEDVMEALQIIAKEKSKSRKAICL